MIYIFNEYQSSKTNGLGVYIAQLIEITKKTGVEVSLINLNSDKEKFRIEEENEIPNFNFPRVILDPLVSDSIAVASLLQYHIKDSAQNIYVFNHSPAFSLMEAMKNAFPLSKLLVVIHDFGWTSSLKGNHIKLREIMSQPNDNKEYMTLKKYIGEEKKMYTLADKVICLSDDSHQLLLDVYEVDASKVVKISNGLTNKYIAIGDDTKQKIRKELYIQQNEIVLLHVGRINHVKGSIALLKSFKEVLNKYSKCRLVVVGNIHNSQEILKISNSFSSRVTFTGHISKEEMGKWYQIANMGILPSYTEQCSYTGMEMMMYGLPIVCSDAFGVRCMFEDNVNARLAKIEDFENDNKYIANLTKSILRLLGSSKLRSAMSHRSLERYQKEYADSIMLKRYQVLFEYMLKNT